MEIKCADYLILGYNMDSSLTIGGEMDRHLESLNDRIAWLAIWLTQANEVQNKTRVRELESRFIEARAIRNEYSDYLKMKETQNVQEKA